MLFPFLLAALAAPPPSSCVVSRIVDGDTFECRTVAAPVRVRLLGVDAPERGQRALGARARDALARAIPPGTAVRLELDVRPVDRYGRVLAYVWRGPVHVNAALVRDGWLEVYVLPPNVRRAEELRAARAEARGARRGFWQTDGFACAPSDYRRGRCG